jgi:hypothetical protein
MSKQAARRAAVQQPHLNQKKPTAHDKHANSPAKQIANNYDHGAGDGLQNDTRANKPITKKRSFIQKLFVCGA